MPPRFYLVHGPDEFAAAEFVDGLKAKVGDPAMADLNTTQFDGRSASLAAVRSAADAMPFLAARRLVIVDGWLSKLQGRGDADGEAEVSASAKETLAALKDYLPDLPDSTWLVFLERRALPPKHVILQLASRSEWAEVKFCDQPKGPELADWIRKRAKRAGGEFTREAAQALAASEHDPRALDQEVSKLLTYVNWARPVEADDVDLLAAGGGEASVFVLVDAIGERKAARAARELHQLLESQEPLFVLGMIVRQFRLLLQAQEILQARGGENEVAQALNLRPFVAQKICSQARGFARGALERIYRRLLEYDAAIKHGQFDAAAALDTLVASLAA